jgi:YjbE family integral membrane protein
MDWMSSEVWIALWQIVIVDVLLSGDNAVVIALACRNLPDKQRNTAVLAGTAGAVIARLIFCFTISTLLEITALKLIGGILLLWIGIKLMQPEEHDEGGTIKTAAGLFGAIQTIVIADLVMSLDNVIGIVAAAKGHFGLIAFGLCLSIPLIVFGSKIVMRMLTRFPVLVIAGAGLLGWLAGEIMVHDPLVPKLVLHHETSHAEALVACMTGALIVVVLGSFMKRRKLARQAERRSRAQA